MAVTVPEWNLADRLVKARRVAGLEQQDLADYLGLARPTISNWERGLATPRVGYLRLWALRCNVPLDWLEPSTRWYIPPLRAA